MWWLPLFKLGKGVRVVKQRYLQRRGLIDDDRD
jgi:hypothetical protein